MPGTLYVVATPIGNLEDLTFRALRTLREVDLVAAEDTRRTLKLLNHYQVRKPLVSLREHNEAREAERLVGKILAGENVALVSDAGTPGIADPGARLVRTSRERGIKIVPIPGPSAVVAALSISGLESPEFVFMGFPPVGGAARTQWFDRLGADLRTIVFFEAPHRIRRTIAELRFISVERPIYIYRELTKAHEELVIKHNTDSSFQGEASDRGEFTLIVAAKTNVGGKILDERDAAVMFGRLTDVAGFKPDEALHMLGSLLGVSTRAMTKAVKKGRILGKQSNLPSA